MQRLACLHCKLSKLYCVERLSCVYQACQPCQSMCAACCLCVWRVLLHTQEDIAILSTANCSTQLWHSQLTTPLCFPMRLQVLSQLNRLHVLTLSSTLGRGDQLRTFTECRRQFPDVKLMTPTYCEHAGQHKASKFSRILTTASSLLGVKSIA